MSESHEFYMEQALALAEEAGAMDEVPVGAVVVYQGQVIGRGFNQVITRADPSAHAEMLALREAAAYLGNYRLLDTRLYVTLEPCPMCAGLLVHARVGQLIFGAADPKTGACGSVLDLTRHAAANHYVEVQGGILQARCADKLSAFFQRRRAAKKALKQAARNYSASS